MLFWKSRSIPMMVVSAAAVIVLGLGCDGGPPVETSKTEATVHGKVVIRGKPAKGGRIWFDPANYRRKDVAARDAEVSADGSYEITTLIGENSVRYEGPATRKDRELDGTVQGFDVKDGDNQFDVILPLR